MIRVLHVLGGLNRGGDETMVMNLYRKIDRTQIQFDFVIHTAEHQAYYDEILSLGGKIYSFPAFNGMNYFLLKKKWNSLFTEHPEYKIIHSHIRSYASLYLPIAQKYGIKTIIHSHNTSNGRGFSSFVKMVLQIPLRWQSDYLFACSEKAGEWLFGKKACKNNNFFVIHNAIDARFFAFNEEIRKKYRKDLKLQDKYVIGHVGRFVEQKNHNFLTDVFYKIVVKKPDARLLLIGDGELQSQIKNKVKDLQIADKVLFLGSRNDVANLMQAMDVFLFPSLWEGLPVVAIEAQASGLPCILSNNIADEVNISSLVKMLDLNDSIDKWVNTVCDESFQRKNVVDEIIKSGYDVNQTVQWIEKFYKSII